MGWRENGQGRECSRARRDLACASDATQGTVGEYSVHREAWERDLLVAIWHGERRVGKGVRMARGDLAMKSGRTQGIMSGQGVRL